MSEKSYFTKYILTTVLFGLRRVYMTHESTAYNIELYTQLGLGWQLPGVDKGYLFLQLHVRLTTWTVPFLGIRYPLLPASDKSIWPWLWLQAMILDMLWNPRKKYSNTPGKEKCRHVRPGWRRKQWQAELRVEDRTTRLLLVQQWIHPHSHKALVFHSVRIPIIRYYVAYTHHWYNYQQKNNSKV